MNHTFKVAGLAKVTPWVRACAIANGAMITDDCKKPGLSVEVLVLFSKVLGFDYEVLWTRSTDEMEEAVLNGTADFSLNFLAATPERWESYIVLPPLNFLAVGFATRIPEGTVSEMPVFRPFHLTAWVCLAAAFFTIVFIIATAQAAWNNIPDVAFHLLAFTLNQTENLQERSAKASVNIIMTSFAIFLVLVQTLYSSVLVSVLCPGSDRVPFDDTDSLAHLIEKGQRRIFTQTLSSTYFTRIKNSTAPPHVRMWNALKKTPPRYYQSESDVVPTLISDGTLVTPMSSLTYASHARTYGTCMVQYVKDKSLVETWESVVMRKDFPHADAFKRVLKQGLQSLILEIANRDYYYRYDGSPCSEKSGELRPVHLEYLALVFGFCLGGLSLALASFLFEMVSAKCSYRVSERLYQVTPETAMGMESLSDR